MARVVAGFGTSHSTMLFSSIENWQAMFDHVDCRAPIYDFEGKPRSFEELLKSTSASASSKISAAAQADRHLLWRQHPQCAGTRRTHDQLVPPGPTQAHGGEARALLPLPRRARHLHCGRTDRPGFRHHGDEIAEWRAVRRSRLFVYPPAIYAGRTYPHRAHHAEHLLPAKSAKPHALLRSRHGNP